MATLTASPTTSQNHAASRLLSHALGRAVLALTALFALSLSHAQAPAPDPVRVSLFGFIVTEATLDDGTVVEVFTEATSASPGQVIEYRISAEHVGEGERAVRRLILTGPLAAQVRYLPESALPVDGEWLLEVSLDGVTFAPGPLVREELDADGRPVLVEVDPVEYRALRWVLQRALEPGEEIAVRYRVVVL
jgi:hypothetical protein